MSPFGYKPTKAVRRRQHSTSPLVCRANPCYAHDLQVFRTYNASVTLDRLLWSNKDGLPGDGIAAEGTVDAKKASYDRANKEVGRGGGQGLDWG